MITTKKLFFSSHLSIPRKEWLLAIVVMLFSSYSLLAQNDKTITGVVTLAKDAMPLPGVNVMIKGTNKVTSTSVDGDYAIKASANDILVFSYIGSTTQEIKVGNQTTINIALKDDVNKLDEVVVIGYGTQKKSDLSGAVGVVNMGSAKKTVTYDTAKMLQGQVAGVTVQSSGEPGGFVNVKIRGANSFTNNNPLFVIDGMIVDSPFDFAPGDIESMQVLKDASSAAIYGVRGANGVVIITTKKGKAGFSTMNFSTDYAISSLA